MLGFGKRYPPSPGSRDRLLVGHLMASAPPRSRAANTASTAVSLVAHALVVLLLVWITADGTPGTLPPPGIDIFLPADPGPPPLPPPPAVNPPAAPIEGSTTGRPDILGTLTAPPVIPNDIVPPVAGPLTDEAIFGGRGETPGSGRPGSGAGPEAGAIEDHPGVFVPMTVAPELVNRAAVERALVRLYPAMLRDAGVGGEALVWVLIDEQGVVVRSVLQESSGYPQLDAAALQVAATMRFRPALNADVRVKVWVAVPVHFRTAGADR
jgi:TonB family protein